MGHRIRHHLVRPQILRTRFELRNDLPRSVDGLGKWHLVFLHGRLFGDGDPNGRFLGDFDIDLARDVFPVKVPPHPLTRERDLRFMERHARGRFHFRNQGRCRVWKSSRQESQRRKTRADSHCGALMRSYERKWKNRM